MRFQGLGILPEILVKCTESVYCILYMYIYSILYMNIHYHVLACIFIYIYTQYIYIYILIGVPIMGIKRALGEMRNADGPVDPWVPCLDTTDFSYSSVVSILVTKKTSHCWWHLAFLCEYII
jgi:hypothetical protein